MIGTVGVAAAGYGVALVQRRHQLHVIAVEHTLRYRLRPGILLIRRAEIGGGIPQQILVEVAAGHAPVPRVVLRLHVRQQQLQLLGGDGAVAGIGRQVQVVQHQLFAALRRDAADGIAAIQIQQLHEAALHRQLHPVRRRDVHRREGQQPGLRRAVGLRQRVQQVGRVVVLAEHAALVKQGGVQRLPLVHMVAAGGVRVHLLQEIEIRVLLLEIPGDGVHVGRQALLRPGAGLRAAVHEEAVVLLVGAEADIPRHHRVRLPRRQRRRGVRRLHRRQRLVADAVVADEHIGHIRRRQQHHRQQDDQQYLHPFFHRNDLLGLLFS